MPTLDQYEIPYEVWCLTIVLCVSEPKYEQYKMNDFISVHCATLSTLSYEIRDIFQLKYMVYIYGKRRSRFLFKVIELVYIIFRCMK